MTEKYYSNWSSEDFIAEIERLRKQKKYGLVWEDKPEDVVEQCKTELPVLEEVKSLAITTDDHHPTNLLIEGDNYHALSVLNYTHKGKIDVIYIDPPYNTGSKDWKYNNNFVDKHDTYRHSKWLSMMANRLRLAKKLLKRGGVLICTIDENESNRLGLLLEKIYVNHEIHFVTIVHNPRGVQGKNFSYTHEYACFVFRSGMQVIGQKKRDIPLEEEFRDHGGESLRTDAKNCFYPILVANGKIVGFGDLSSKSFHPASKNTALGNKIIEVWPIDKNGVERKWVFARHTVEQIREKLFAKKKKNGEIDIFRVKDTQRPKTVWIDEKYDASTFGSKIVNNLSAMKFPYPKSIFSVKDCIDIVKAKPDALILDFFAGSGTTGHAVSLLNKEDAGSRRFILCTNNENDIARKVCYPRIKAVIKGNGNSSEIIGIASNLKYFKTTFVPAESTDKNKTILTQKAITMLCVKEDTFKQVRATARFHIFRNEKRYTGIILDQRSITTFKKAIAKMDGKFSVYIFSLGDETFEDEFEDVKNKVSLSPIPQAILRIYRQIHRGK